MNDHTQYLEALDAYLSRHLSDELRKRRVDEIRTHLTLDQADREADGVEPAKAAQLARIALGSPRVLARQMIRQARGYEAASAGRLTWVCGFALTLSYSVPLWFLLKVPAPGWADPAIHWLPFLVLIGFGCLVARTQRWLIWPTAAWSFLAVIVAAYVGVAAIPAWHPATAQTLQSIRQSIQSVTGEQTLVQQWMKGEPPLDRAPIAVRNTVSSMYVPMLPVNYSSSEIDDPLSSVGTPDEARKLWNGNGALYARDIQNRLANLRLLLADEQRPNPSGGFQWRTMSLILAYQTAEQVVLFAAVNWAVLVLSGLAQRRRNRRDPLLA